MPGREEDISPLMAGLPGIEAGNRFGDIFGGRRD